MPRWVTFYPVLLNKKTTNIEACEVQGNSHRHLLIYASHVLGIFKPGTNFRSHNHTELVLFGTNQFGMTLSNFKQRMMEQNEPATDSSGFQKCAVSFWQRMKFSFGISSGIRSLKSKPIENDEDHGDQKIEVPKLPEEGDSSERPPKFKATGRRSAICTVLEEKHLCFGIPLSELRRELVVRNLLIKLELL